MEAVDPGAPITVPVGAATLGRVFNVLGEPIDEAATVDRTISNPIHREAPHFDELVRHKQKFLKQELKLSTCWLHMSKGGKIGLFGGAGVGKTVTMQELIQQHCSRARRYFRICRCW